MSTEITCQKSRVRHGHYKMRAYIDGQWDRKAEKLSPRMWHMLFDTQQHGDPFYDCDGMSERGAAKGTLWALRRRGLMVGFNLTDAGKRVLTVEWCHPDKQPNITAEHCP